jgi:hypothetical protein
MVKYRILPQTFLLIALRKVSSMIRTLLVLVLAGAYALAQTGNTSAGQSTSNVHGAQVPAPPMPQQFVAGPESVAPDATVVVFHGVCPNDVAAASGSCTTTITKKEFNSILDGMNLATQLSTPAAMRNFAETYMQLLALASAAEKAGVDKDPRFEQLMRVARMRALADTYRHTLDEKYSNPPAEEIQAYYQQNAAKYEALKVERIIIPNANSSRTPAARAEFDKKFHQLADDIHERAARGEETQKLQDEAYKALALPSPPKTDLGMKRMGSLPAGIERDLSALRPGEVTKLESEMSGLNIYKLRSRDTIPLEFVKAEIIHDLRQKNIEAAMKAISGSVHADFNDQFFGTQGVKGGPILRPMQPGDQFPKGVTPATPMGR